MLDRFNQHPQGTVEIHVLVRSYIDGGLLD